ncbi:phage baseplate assembly protein V [Roseibium sediminis]|uniref:phage baseplate assembly protein V n=1 Tax=Roseibium sediminis TaxID=1775174 RepID=UPI00123CA9C8|nr:phage baseplate assembly protein V [Roseibium sediminis]
MRSETARELRTLRRLLAQAESRMARMHMTGKVHPGSQDMKARTIRLELGETTDGKPILSPPVRWANPGNGRLKIHSAPGDNEQMTLFNPSGTIGQNSLAQYATYDDDNPPPSDQIDETVIKYGDTVIVLKGDEARVKSGKVIIESDDVNLGGDGGKRVARIGDKVSVKSGSSKGLWPIVEGSSIVKAVD